MVNGGMVRDELRGGMRGNRVRRVYFKPARGRDVVTIRIEREEHVEFEFPVEVVVMDVYRGRGGSDDPDEVEVDHVGRDADGVVWLLEEGEREEAAEAAAEAAALV